LVDITHSLDFLSAPLIAFTDGTLFPTFFLDPLLKMNCYVHDSTELDHQDFMVSYIVRYAKRPPLAECRILDYSKLSSRL